MGDIVLSAGIRSNLLSIQNTAKLLDQTQTRLATGLKVNGAIDDPTAFFTAQGLNNRARDLESLLSSMDQAVQTLDAADQGIKSVIKLIENAKATANQALVTKIKASTATSTNSTAFTGTQTISTIAGVDNGDSFTIQVGTAAAVTVNIAATNQAVSVILASLSGITDVTAYLTTDGKIKIEATNGEDLAITDVSGSAANSLGVSGTSTNGVNRRSFESDFNALRTQMDQLISDASYKGVNLLQATNDLTVFFNEGQTSSLTINSRLLDTSSAGMNISEIVSKAWATDGNISGAIDQLDQAVITLRQQASTFGGNLSVVETRSDFTENMINTLVGGASNLTIADTNEEGANLLALQTRQSLGTTALSLASQADQNVLQLF
ncbi:flagellin N-terminal helical domain-containing protein [Pyruvatibacter sp. HU-CL02332]|uniref:flagellin N-terminal helical domain-containing protein n=1 Tax=Pyruvatibacter sp. HU-CL02332 TaxID=3127650 RepID=UPI002969F57D|nr:flagellin [Alphaproteobacteria bacterium]